MGTQHFTKEQRQEIILSSVDDKFISETFGICQATIVRWKREMGYKSPRGKNKREKTIPNIRVLTVQEWIDELRLNHNEEQAA
jgi:hypothetical protein